MDEPATLEPAFPVVAMVASVGGLAALTAVLSHLPGDFAGAVVIVQHLAPNRPSLLAPILGQSSALPIREARQGDRLRSGLALVAPPDHHLIVQSEATLALTSTTRVHYSRPSADALLESLGRELGPRAIAVILTGSGNDGAGGARIVKQAGGIVLAQDRATSQSFGMPGAAIQTGCVDAVLPLHQIAPTLVQLVRATTARDRPRPAQE